MALDKPASKVGGVKQRDNLRLSIGLTVLVIMALVLPQLTAGAIGSRFQTFVTIFLGIFIEAIPFLLIGSVVSGAD